MLLVGALVAISVGGPAAPPVRAADPLYLTVQLYGNGSGAWLSADGYIDCRSVYGYVDPRNSCFWPYEPGPNGLVTVVYNVIPATGSCYRTGTHACGGAVMGASTTFGSDLSKSATFELIPYTLTVTRSGAGSGKVTSYPSGIDCGSTCTDIYYYSNEVHLTAVADAGAYFAGWTGACAGQGATCELSIAGVTSTNAVFGFGAAPTPSPTAGPTPSQTAPVTPGPTSTKPAATPKASAAPPSTTAPVASGSTATTGPTDSDPAPSSAATPTGPAEASTDPAATALTATPPPVSPASGTTDLGPIALAILGAGLLIALGIGAAAFLATRRRPAPPG